MHNGVAVCKKVGVAVGAIKPRHTMVGGSVQCRGRKARPCQVFMHFAMLAAANAARTITPNYVSTATWVREMEEAQRETSLLKL